MKPLLYESHMHTTLCRHARGEVEEYAAHAEKRGLKGIVVTCHNPLPDGLAQGSRMYPDQWEKYLELIERARAAWAGRVDVRAGLEADYFPGLEPFIEKQTSSAPLHHVLGSVHPHIRDYRERYYEGDDFAYQKLYFHHLAQAAETGLYDTLAHPDLIKNSVSESWNIDLIFSDVQRALDRIAATETAMELNTSGLNKVVPEMNPGPQILRAMREREIPVVLGADAHIPQRVAADYETALDLLETAGYKTVSFFLERKRQDVPITDARASLKREGE